MTVCRTQEQKEPKHFKILIEIELEKRFLNDDHESWFLE